MGPRNGALVWGPDCTASTRQVDLYISKLRAKLRPELIRSVWGVGYRLEA